MKSSRECPCGNDSASTAEEALRELLKAFRAGRVGQRQFERGRLQEHLARLSQQWDERFPGLPREPLAYSTFRGVAGRGVRDAYLKEIIVELLEGVKGKDKTIVNPACVWGRHARDLARRLPAYTVMATDIRAEMDRVYRYLPLTKTPKNFTFQPEDIFEPTLVSHATAVVFFGACGSLSDAAMDYALQAGARFLICRTCCHENIAGNTEMVKRFNTLNFLFRLKNIAYAYKRKQKTGEYFSARYAESAYPRSQSARRLSSAAEFLRAARRSVDSDVCRSIIDLDRFLHLTEAGYAVRYRTEMFVAQRKDE